MADLILITCISGAGYLRRALPEAQTLIFDHRLVDGPIPAGGPPEDFFRYRRALYDADGLFYEDGQFTDVEPDENFPRSQRRWSTLPEACRDAERVILWIDPDANAQLILIQLLDWLGHLPDILPKLWLKQSESPTGEHREGDWWLPPRPILPADVALAQRAWDAFRAPTPERWARLRHDPDLALLPGLPTAVERMLEELPDGTGLGASARQLLRLVERPNWTDRTGKQGGTITYPPLPRSDRKTMKLMYRFVHSAPRRPLQQESHQLLCDLASAPHPAVSGTTEPHAGIALMMDSARYMQFRRAVLSWTDFGRRLVAGEDDWSRHNPILHWWGGTRLTNDTLWRWNPDTKTLLPPGPPSPPAFH
ncbi:hypothetical protein ACMAUO_11260 [Gluconacetobacter sp. Hr-1-5]|uniref:hypothetical protein n=1 Tax=Gluconacetobacter sp. Hr-1-5 TaxID=3395370 RepID=UPI003B51FA71